MEKILQIDPSEFRQYTWLKDKNGVEIYDGDILKAKINGGLYNYIDKGFVIFHPEAAKFVLEKNGMHWLRLCPPIFLL